MPTIEIQPVNQAAKLVRRRLYRIPVVVLKAVNQRVYSGALSAFNEVPVLGPAHSDAEIGVPHAHYHIDWRFMPAKLRRDLRDSYGTGHEKGIVVFSFDVHDRGERELPYILPADPWPTHIGGVRVRATLEELYAGQQLKPGLICPHRGADLSHCEADENGIVECPMHGLRWHKDTGELAPAAPIKSPARNFLDYLAQTK